jgi:hypothetical protein
MLLASSSNLPVVRVVSQGVAASHHAVSIRTRAAKSTEGSGSKVWR